MKLAPNALAQVKAAAKADLMLWFRDRVMAEAEPIMAAHLLQARNGNMMAIRDFWDRLLGRPLEQTQATVDLTGHVHVHHHYS